MFWSSCVWQMLLGSEKRGGVKGDKDLVEVLFFFS